MFAFPGEIQQMMLKEQMKDELVEKLKLSTIQGGRAEGGHSGWKITGQRCGIGQ